MRSLVVTEVAQELPRIVPFLPNYTVVALNATATAEVVQTSDALAGTYTTLATIPPGKALEITLNNPFIKLVDAGSIVLLAN